MNIFRFVPFRKYSFILKNTIINAVIGILFCILVAIIIDIFVLLGHINNLTQQLNQSASSITASTIKIEKLNAKIVELRKNAYYATGDAPAQDDPTKGANNENSSN